MATKKKQSPRFTADEISILSGLVGKHKTIIECKKTDSVSSNLKNETWEKLCNEYNCLPGVSPRDSNQLKKCWGNLKQKWKNERSDEKRKTHKTVAGHMATRLDNDNDSDGAAYLPPVQNEPVVRLLEGMIDCDPVYDHAHTGAGGCSGRSGTNEPAQKVTEMCNFVMQRMALTPGQQETPPQEPRPHLTVPVYMGYDDVKSVADFLGKLQTYHLAFGASKAFIMSRITRLREEFLPVGYATQILRELEARPQHLDESQDRYVQVMQELFKRADPNTPESDRVARVRRQCHPRYHAYLINHTFEALEELARGACLIEEALHAERNYVPPPPAKYALKPACPEASTQVGCSNDTSLPHHINRESWHDMYDVRPCKISGCSTNSHREVLGGHSRACEDLGRGLPRQVGGCWPCPIASWGPTEITIQADHLYQCALASAGENWHAAVEIPQPCSIDPRHNGTTPPHNS
ncbi:hypothetical protein ISCGN_002709 [Ixodes scapularis]